MLSAVWLISYLCAVAFYHADIGRARLSGASPSLLSGLRMLAWLLLLLVIVGSVTVWGAERGIPIALCALSLAFLFSLLLASRWPRMHWKSAPVAAVLVIVALAL